jgi:sulfoxide reductase heme-binding subunit YedZ
VIATSTSQLLWYTTRGTGIVALILLSATMGLGILTTVRLHSSSWPKFALQELHRRVTLVAMVFLGLHILTTLLDPFVPIGWVTVIVPFTSPYRRVWVAFGTIAVDVLIAVVGSSLLRHRMNARTWRLLHWLAYACWPLALVHGLGSGTDRGLGWVDVIVALCVLSVAGVSAWRLVAGLHSRTAPPYQYRLGAEVPEPASPPPPRRGLPATGPPRSRPADADGRVVARLQPRTRPARSGNAREVR